MKIPRYWARGEHEGVTCWRSSDLSVADARTRAVNHARTIATRLDSGQQLNRYQYGTQPLREEVLMEVAGVDGGPAAVITRNAYGAEVLNARRVLFADIDFDSTPDAGAAASGGVALVNAVLSWFGGGDKSRPAAVVPLPRAQEQAVSQVRAIIDANPGWGARVYRTAAGLRCILTHDLFDAVSLSTQQLLESLDSDPLYVKLCRAQECFRARLTPKPWRCSMPQMTARYPCESPAEKRAFDGWLARYNAAIKPYAACHLVECMGEKRMHPEVEKIVKLHDERCRATSTSLALA